MFRSIRHALALILTIVIGLVIVVTILRGVEQLTRPATEYVFFSYGESPDHTAISVINNDRILPLTKEFDSWYHFDISPDCQSVVYTSQAYEKPGFFVAGLNGVKHWYEWDFVPSKYDGALMYPRYSSDGNTVAFTFLYDTGKVERTQLSLGFVEKMQSEKGVILHSIRGTVGYDFHIVYRETEDNYLDGLRWDGNDAVVFRSTENTATGLSRYYKITLSTGMKEEISGRDYSFLSGDAPQKSVPPVPKYAWTSLGSVCWTK